MSHQESFDKIKFYANDLGYDVVEVGLDSWDPHTKIICNNKRRVLPNRNIYLLHEVGHALLFLKYEDIYYDLFPGFENESHKDVSEFEVESLAWEYGLELATKKLRIDLDMRRFASIKTSCLKSYR
jgi:hypothetical protein